MGLLLAAGTYDIDRVHSQLGFAVTHLDISVIRGTFDRFEGTLVVGERLDETTVSVTADTRSINTGNSARDERMFLAGWLDIEAFPTMAFRSTRIEPAGDGFALEGELTIKDEVHPTTFSVTYHGSAVFPVDRSTHHGFSAVATISRSAFGVSLGLPVVSDDVRLTLELQVLAPAAPSTEAAATAMSPA
jgi:polyisoprenoid-binding protein YceI